MLTLYVLEPQGTGGGLRLLIAVSHWHFGEHCTLGLGRAGPKSVCSEVLVTEGEFQCHYFLLEKVSQLLRCKSPTGTAVRSPVQAEGHGPGSAPRCAM